MDKFKAMTPTSRSSRLPKTKDSSSSKRVKKRARMESGSDDAEADADVLQIPLEDHRIAEEGNVKQRAKASRRSAVMVIDSSSSNDADLDKDVKEEDAITGGIPDGEEDEGPKEFEVERIMAKRTHNGVLQYQIKWVGYSKSESTWEPLDNISGCDEKVREFEQQEETRRKTSRSTVRASLSETVLANRTFQPKAVNKKPQKIKTTESKEDSEGAPLHGDSIQTGSPSKIQSPRALTTYGVKCPTADTIYVTPSRQLTHLKKEASSQKKKMVVKAGVVPPKSAGTADKPKKSKPNGTTGKARTLLPAPMSVTLPAADWAGMGTAGVLVAQLGKPGSSVATYKQTGGITMGPKTFLETMLLQPPVKVKRPPAAPKSHVVTADQGTSVELDEMAVVDEATDLTPAEKQEIRELRLLANKANKIIGMISAKGAFEPYVMISFEGAPMAWVRPFSLSAVKRILPLKLLNYYESLVTIST
ncbi:hypothetical protein BV898_07002 [Hypsibius exemplaris]|uniref:Chromo domain-containing protein n=1 Tax=Hypsibius exemplaris TaxID=2072580 RepID=A0A1W0WUW8_HYPEX|nr:hypothetical protein BV898_07002 [Hypsibius exemplaris]